MKLYADSSWWVALKCRADIHRPAATRLLEEHPDSDLLWTPWQRVEVFNTFRQAEHAGLLKAGEARQAIRLLEQEVRLGYWPHVEFDWTDAARTACELSAGHSLSRLVRAMDLFHVAIALEVAADAFVSFDTDQNALATAAGLPLVELRGRERQP